MGQVSYISPSTKHTVQKSELFIEILPFPSVTLRVSHLDVPHVERVLVETLRPASNGRRKAHSYALYVSTNAAADVRMAVSDVHTSVLLQICFPT